MKIHIVRKGDTLWEIARQYGVDFEELKQFNPQLSSPDMIMPGMKIKIPSAKKEVKKEVKKETIKVTEPKAPIAKETPKKLPVVQEDDHEKAKEVKIQMPVQFTPGTPPKPITPKPITPKPITPKKEVPKAPVKPVKEAPIVKKAPKQPVKPLQEMVKMPVLEEELHIKLPQTSQPKKQLEQQTIQQPPVAPIYHYHHYYCCCPPPCHPCFSSMDEMAGGFIPQQQMMPPQDCGCCGPDPHFQPYQNYMREQVPGPPPGLSAGAFEQFPHVGPQLQSAPFEVPMFQPVVNSELQQSFDRPLPTPPSFPPISEFNAQNSERGRIEGEDESNSK